MATRAWLYFQTGFSENKRITMCKRRNYFKVLLAASVFILFAAACKEKDRGITDKHLPDLNVLFQGYDQLDSTRAYTQFAEKLLAANKDLRSSEIFIEAASLFHQAGKDEKVAELLNTAIDNGMANPKIPWEISRPKFRCKAQGRSKAIWPIGFYPAEITGGVAF